MLEGALAFAVNLVRRRTTAADRLARTIDDYADPAAARREPSLQLVGREGDDAADVDLASVQRRGVSLLGRLDSVTGQHATFRDDLPGNVVDADSRLCHLLESIDAASPMAREASGRSVCAERIQGRHH